MHPFVHYNIDQKFAVQCVDFFSCDNCLHSPKSVIFLIFIEFSFPFRSDISVNCLCTNGQQTDVQNICQPFVHKYSVDDLCTKVQKGPRDLLDSWYS